MESGPRVTAEAEAEAAEEGSQPFESDKNTHDVISLGSPVNWRDFKFSSSTLSVRLYPAEVRPTHVYVTLGRPEIILDNLGIFSSQLFSKYWLFPPACVRGARFFLVGNQILTTCIRNG